MMLEARVPAGMLLASYRGAHLTKAHDVTIQRYRNSHTKIEESKMLWNFTQNFEPIHRKICILRGVKNLTTDDLFRVMTS